MEYVIYAIAALAVFALIIFPDFRKKLGVLIDGFLNVFVEDQAKTPEGAEAIYNRAIADKEEHYYQASQVLNKLSGELNHAKANAAKLKNQIKSCEEQCEVLVKRGHMQEAQAYADRRAELMSDLDYENQKISKLTPMVAQAQEIYTTYDRSLRELKRQKKETISKIKMNSQMKEMYNDMDELLKDSATDKMMAAVLEGSSELEKEADGARVVHESRTSTKVARAEQKAARAQSDEYLANLAKKYNNGGNK